MLTPVADLPRVEAPDIAIDGRIEEAAWERALVVRGFRAAGPRWHEDARFDTEVRLLADGRALYVAWRAHDPMPERIRAYAARRDEAWSSDRVALLLDPSGDGSRGYTFVVTAGGGRDDGVRVAGGGLDTSWDGLWSAAARRDAGGWTAEMRIPWSTVHHPERVDLVGVVLSRWVARTGESSTWPELDPSVHGLLLQRALLRGPGEVAPERRATLVPELAGAWGTGEDPRPGVAGLHPGLTLRWRPLSAVEAAATVLPDFSEVESDGFRSEVNRRFPVHWPEKRPFFLDGTEWFDSPWGEVLDTRRIELPAYGVRATAERAGWVTAALHAWDLEPQGSVTEGEDAWTADAVEGSSALVTALRVRRDLGEDGFAGLWWTDRTVPGAGLGNRVVGGDGRLRLSPHAVVQGGLLFSETVRGGAGVGPAPAARLHLSATGEHPFLELDARALHPDFRDENGWVLVTDRVGGGASAGWRFRPGWAWLPDLTFTPLSVWEDRSTDGALQDRGAAATLRVGLGNGGGGSLSGQAWGERYEGAWLPQRAGSASVWADWTSWLASGGWGSVGRAAWYSKLDVGDKVSAGGWLTLRPTRHLRLRQSMAWERMALDDGEGYAGTVGRSRLELFLARDAWLRLIYDWSEWTVDTDDRRHLEGLVAWEGAPGRALYLGGQVDLAEQAEWWLQAKATWSVAL